jgi:hypothetical protein
VTDTPAPNRPARDDAAVFGALVSAAMQHANAHQVRIEQQPQQNAQPTPTDTQQ